MNTTFRKYLYLALFLVLVEQGAACGGGGTTSAPPATSAVLPTEPVLAVTATPPVVIASNARLDPAIADDDALLLISSYIYESLVRMEGDLPTLSLAIGWAVSDDGLHYTFQLRPGVTFHDGTPFNADAVIANFNRWFDPQHPLHDSFDYAAWERVFLGFKGEKDANGVPRSSFDGIEKVDDLTVTLHLNRPDQALLLNLTLVYFDIVSPGMLAAEGPAYGLQTGHTAGTGPYTLAEWNADHIILRPNPDYWGVIPGNDLEFSIK